MQVWVPYLLSLWMDLEVVQLKQKKNKILLYVRNFEARKWCVFGGNIILRNGNINSFHWNKFSRDRTFIDKFYLCQLWGGHLLTLWCSSDLPLKMTLLEKKRKNLFFFDRLSFARVNASVCLTKWSKIRESSIWLTFADFKCFKKFQKSQNFHISNFKHFL